MGFQDNLRFYREKAGYKQAKEFAKVLNIPYNTYVAYENQGREPKFKTLCKISNLLNVSIDTLLNGEGNKLDIEDDTQIKSILNDAISLFDDSLSMHYKIYEHEKIKSIILDTNYKIASDFFNVSFIKLDDVIEIINDTKKENDERLKQVIYFLFLAIVATNGLRSLVRTKYGDDKDWLKAFDFYTNMRDTAIKFLSELKDFDKIRLILESL